jgi:hypothetical protein
MASCCGQCEESENSVFGLVVFQIRKIDQALEALRTMHVVDIRVGAEIRRGVTAGNHQARQILAALGITRP